MSGEPGEHDWRAPISREELITIQRRLQTQFAAAPSAFSTDGKTFGFEAPIDYPLPAGSYVQIGDEDEQYVGQIIDKSIESREGPELALSLNADLSYFSSVARIDQATVRPRIQYVRGRGILLGKVVDEALETPMPTDVFQHASLSPATPALINLHLRAGSPGDDGLVVGQAMYGDETNAVHLNARGFGRHTFLCGQSGSGKTYSLGVVIEQLLLGSQLRLVIFDPNSDYVRLRETQPGADQVHSPDVLDRYNAVRDAIRIRRPTPRSTEERLTIRFRDLERHEQAVVLHLDPLRDREEYSGFWRLVENLGGDSIELNDVLEASIKDTAAESRQINLRVRNLGVSEWSIWCGRDEPSCIADLDEPWRALVLDIGTLGLTAEKEVVTLAMLSQLWRRRNERKATLIVIDEAHNICPAEPETALSSLLTESVVRIAAEGRKFGLYLLLASQRPQKIHPNVLSQCDNLMLMRMNSIADLNYLSEVFSFVSPNLLSEASHFRQGNSLIAGQVVPTATLARFGQRISQEGGSDVPVT